jgi:hypothetical protein
MCRQISPCRDGESVGWDADTLRRGDGGFHDRQGIFGKSHGGAADDFRADPGHSDKQSLATGQCQRSRMTPESHEALRPPFGGTDSTEAS